MHFSVSILTKNNNKSYLSLTDSIISLPIWIFFVFVYETGGGGEENYKETEGVGVDSEKKLTKIGSSFPCGQVELRLEILRAEHVESIEDKFLGSHWDIQKHERNVLYQVPRSPGEVHGLIMPAGGWCVVRALLTLAYASLANSNKTFKEHQK